jgi:hypothetical protein
MTFQACAGGGSETEKRGIGEQLKVSAKCAAVWGVLDLFRAVCVTWTKSVGRLARSHACKGQK